MHAWYPCLAWYHALLGRYPVATDSQETGRGYDTFNISDFDLYDTYLPPFESAFKKGKSSGLMCSCKAARVIGVWQHDIAKDQDIKACLFAGTAAPVLYRLTGLHNNRTQASHGSGRVVPAPRRATLPLPPALPELGSNMVGRLFYGQFTNTRQYCSQMGVFYGC